ncbi:hypothetical protein B296_00049248 [Ensete ventricosum]|uniref:Uncharacterized protein n=1 Tax=Ensete ventricosum TaxID=4639 RepID=A0A426Y967_ENSVE|nr:hypothetical protein B296_00049248 [Ensete ventricosum]
MRGGELERFRRREIRRENAVVRASPAENLAGGTGAVDDYCRRSGGEVMALRVSSRVWGASEAAGGRGDVVPHARINLPWLPHLSELLFIAEVGGSLYLLFLCSV